MSQVGLFPLRNDLPQYRTPWTCDVVGSQHTPPKPKPVPAPTGHSDEKCIPNYRVNCNLTCLLFSSFLLFFFDVYLMCVLGVVFRKC